MLHYGQDRVSVSHSGVAVARSARLAAGVPARPRVESERRAALPWSVWISERVYQALWGGRQEWEYTRDGQGWRQPAERIAWRICKTWLEAQITLINLEQAKLEEVFLPYLVMPGNKTLFETMEQNHFLLPEQSKAA